ncbi:hypothetical protein NPX13_g4115 [Xylaria arbuscula]|uniref:Uncharacterized protein n=1 Tax=Xylaria arbuscula TaxID=114810 RepID=A0A9W8TM79_9PEZI|nr:hypothetical protein NPX13_g4115 [Xylaria arbuscula]
MANGQRCISAFGQAIISLKPLVEHSSRLHSHARRVFRLKVPPTDTPASTSIRSGAKKMTLLLLPKGVLSDGRAWNSRGSHALLSLFEPQDIEILSDIVFDQDSIDVTAFPPFNMSNANKLSQDKVLIPQAHLTGGGASRHMLRHHCLCS